MSLTGGSVRVLDDDAEDVATGTSQENETVVATLADGLADGTYTVVFEIVSVDSHRISGASVFHVGAPTSEGLTGDALDLGGAEAGWGVRTGAVILSAIGYAGALVAAGTLCFSLYRIAAPTCGRSPAVPPSSEPSPWLPRCRSASPAWVVVSTPPDETS